jgi:FkbM family methyltransferase
VGGLKELGKSVLKQLGVGERLKASFVRDCYWYVTDRHRIHNRRSEVRFYRNLLRNLPPRGLVFDIGANVGDKTDIFLRLGARVVAVEPDITNQTVIRQKFLKYRLHPKDVQVVGHAVSESVGVEMMLVDGPGSAVNTLSSKWAEVLKADRARLNNSLDRLEFQHQEPVKTITLEHMIAEHGTPFFIKIDVEGNELKVLRGLVRAVPFLSFEVNLPEFAAEGIECLNVLEKLAVNGRFNYSSDCRNGLLLDEWLDSERLATLIARCHERSIEIFWATVPV